MVNRPILRWGSLAVLSLILLTQFVNCADYTTPTSSLASEGATLNCNATTCVLPTPANLQINVNLSTGAQYAVRSGVAEFNLGGDCNEGGYPFNVVYWELYNGTTNVKVRTSNMTGMMLSSPNSTVNTICTNGRFQLYLNLSAIAQDPVNRVGCLSETGATVPYYLYVSILGQTQQGSVGVQNSLSGRTMVNLVPGI